MIQLLVEILILPILAVLFISVLTSTILAQSWYDGASMPTERQEIAATNIGDDIYVVGGLDESGNGLDIVEVYNVNNNSWKSTAPLPQTLHHPAVASYGGKLYVVGGYISSVMELIATNQLFIYDPIKDEWKEGKSMPTSRGALSAVFVKGTLYAIGGMKGDRVLNINEAYNPVTDSWTSKDPMPTGRHHAASTTINGKIYVIGGRTVEFSPSVNEDVNEMYDTKTEKWTAVESMPSKRSGIAAAAINNSIFVFGGEDLTRAFGNNEKYDIKDDKWSSQDSMPTPRHGLAAVSVNNRIFVIGGGPEPELSISGANEIYSIEGTQK